MKAVDIMTPEPQVVTPEKSLVRVASIMRDYDVGVVPVVTDRVSMRPVGLITDRDIAIRHVAECIHHDCTAGEIMSKDVLHSVRPEQDVTAVMTVMRLEKVRRVLVTARNGRLVGIISQADLLLNQGVAHPLEVKQVLAAISEPAILHK
jgi:CBS domain-containing protein